MKKILTLIVSFVLLVAITGCDSKQSSYESLIDTYCQCIQDIDGETYFDLIPDYFKNYVIGKNNYYDNEEELIKLFNDELEDERYSIVKRIGEKFDLTAEIVEEDIFDDDKQQDEINDIMSWYDLEENPSIEAVGEIKARLTAVSPDGEETSSTFRFSVLKIKNKWYFRRGA